MGCEKMTNDVIKFSYHFLLIKVKEYIPMAGFRRHSSAMVQIYHVRVVCLHIIFLHPTVLNCYSNALTFVTLLLIG